MLFRLAWRNIWRNKRRSGITIAAISIGMTGMMFMVGMMNGMLVNMIENSVELETGSVQVHIKGYAADPSVDKLINDPQTMIEKISEVKQVSGISSRIKAFGLVSNKDNSLGAMLVGIDPDKEQLVTSMHRNVRQGNYRSINSYNTILIGQLMAKNLNVKIGDQIIILTQGADGSTGNDLFTVGGIFESASVEMDRAFIYMSLDSAEELLSTYGGVNELALAIKNVNQDKEITQQIIKTVKNSEFEVLSWEEILPGMAQMKTFLLGAIYLFYFIVFGIAAFGISNTLIMAIFERIHELGVMRALGTKPNQIFVVVVIESASMGMVGALIGAAAGYLLSLYFIIFGMDLSWFAQIRTIMAMSPILYFEISPMDIIIGIMFVTLVTTLSSLYPAFKASRLKPAEAIHYI